MTMKISACSLQRLGALHRFDRHRLAEGNVGGFQEPAQLSQVGAVNPFVPLFVNVGGLKRLPHLRQVTKRSVPCSSTKLGYPKCRRACAGRRYSA